MSFFTSLLLCTLLGLSAQEDFDFSAVRDSLESNFFTLECITDLQGGQPNRDAQFLLNGTDVRDFGGEPVPQLDGSSRYQMTRDLEGTYSCHLLTSVSISNSMTLVAVPVFSNQAAVNPTAFIAKAFQNATLQCSIPPGRLIDQYYASWRNGSNGADFISIDPMRVISRTNSRYTINPDTFALGISDVQVSDSLIDFRCVLGVEVTPGLRRTYGSTEGRSISLTVYKPPVILQAPIPQTISLEVTREAYYNCSVVSEPAATITWRHNGEDVSDPRLYRSIQQPAVADPQGRGVIVTGSLSIFPVRASFSGKVECVASIMPPSGRGEVPPLPQNISTARLSVLGGFKQLDVLITTEKDVIYKIKLRGTINTPVHLFFEYIDASVKDFNDFEDNDDERSRSRGVATRANRTTATTYNNTDVITHIEFMSEVPFMKFRVRVGLITPELLLGPLNTTVEEFDLSEPSLITSDLLQLKLVIAACVPTILIIVLAITSIFLCHLWFKSSHKKKTLEHENDKLEQLKALIIDLKGNIPPENYRDFLNFSTHLLTVYCTTCTRSLKNGQVNYVRRTEEVRLNLDMEGTDGDADESGESSDSSDGESDKEELKRPAPSKDKGPATSSPNMPAPRDIVTALTNPVRAGLKNPRLRRRLRKQLSLMMPEVTTPIRSSGRRRGKPDEDPLINVKDRGYNSRSASDSSAPDS